MTQKTGRGGSRPNAGRKTAISAGEGEKTRITVALGQALLNLLRAERPGLTDPDLIRALANEAARSSVFTPVRAEFTPAEQEQYEALLGGFAAAGLVLPPTGGPHTALGVRLELAYRALGEQPEVGESVGPAAVQALLYAQREAFKRRMEVAAQLPKRV